MFQQQPLMPKPMKILLFSLVGVYVLTTLLEKGMGLNVTPYLGLVPALGVENFMLWQFVTYGFLHADLTHLLFNCLALWMVGIQLMNLWGPKEFFKFCLICVVGGGLTNVIEAYFLVPLIWGPEAKLVAISKIPLVGASGAVFGLLAAFAIFFGEQTVLVMFLFPMKAKWVAVLFGVISLWQLLVESSFGTLSKISHAAHLGGMAAGFFYLYFKTRRKLRMRTNVDTKREKQKARFRVIVNQNFNDGEDNDSDPTKWN